MLRLYASAVILQYSSKQTHVTLDRVTDSRSAHSWQLPRTVIAPSGSSLTALESGLRKTLGLKDADISYREQLYTFESADDTSSELNVSYLYLSHGTSWHKGSNQIGLFPINRLPKLSKMDGAILNYALERMHAKVLYTNILQYVLPPVFNLSELQDAFETITGQPTDRRNFRKKMLDLGVLHEMIDKNKSMRNLPKSYRFKDNNLTLYRLPFAPRR